MYHAPAGETVYPTARLTGPVSPTSPLQLRKTHVQKSAAFGSEDAGILGRRELDAIALGQLGALDGIGAVQEHRADMLQDILIRLREETRQILDLDHQTRKTLRHTRKPKAMPLGRKDRRGRQIQGVRPLPVERRESVWGQTASDRYQLEAV